MKDVPFLDFHTHRQGVDENVVALVNYFPQERKTEGLGSIGLHPAYLQEETWQTAFEQVETYARAVSIKTIGETGLDKICGTDWGLQTIVFEHHIALAERLQKPMVLHCVRAYQEVLALQKKHRPRMAWVFHGFNKNKDLAQALTQHSCYLSLGTALIRQPDKMRLVLQNLPLDRLFLETDADTRFSIQDVYAAATALLSIPLSDLKTQTWANYISLIEANNG